MKLTLPQLGESVAEGTIKRWLKQAGERVERDEPLVEIDTDKVNAEFPSPVAGILQEILAPEGATLPVGAEIAVIAEVGADAGAHAGPGPAGEAGLESPTAASAGPGVVVAADPNAAAQVDPGVSAGAGAGRPISEPAGQHPAGVVGPRSGPPAEPGAPTQGGEQGDGVRQRTSPFVRRIAREQGVNLAEVTGSGPGGRVRKEDILRYVEARGEAAAAPAAPTPEPREPVRPTAPALAPAVGPAAPAVAGLSTGPSAPSPPAVGAPAIWPGDEVVPTTPMRRAIADHMVRSIHTSPHAWTQVEADVTNLVKLRESVKIRFRERTGVDLTYLPFVIEAVVEGLREYRALNATWVDGQVVLRRRVNIGVAVAVDDGLIVPVIHDADEKNLVGLARAVRDLTSQARARKLKPEDVQGGTFTVNNPGAFGAIASVSIINQPQAAILAVNAIVKRPTVIDDMIAIRAIVNLSLSFDHRILDGAVALRFLDLAKRRLEAYGPETPVI